MNEAKFSTLFRAALRRAGAQVDKIETGETCVGIPDLHVYSEKKGTYWLELKVCNNAAKLTVALRPGQIAWLMDYSDRKGHAYIATWMATTGKVALHQARHASTSASITPMWFNSIQALAEWLEN